MDKKTCMILMVVGGVFYILGGFVAAFIVAALGGLAWGFTGSPEIGRQTREAINVALATGFISGIMIIVGSVLVNSEKRLHRVIGSVIGIIGALIGIINTFAGLVVGLVLTLLGSIGGIVYTPPAKQ